MNHPPYVMFLLLSTCPSYFCLAIYFLYVLQLRAVRAFKSTLDEMEERRSIHSLRTSRSNPGARPLYDIIYIDEESAGPQPTATPAAASASKQQQLHRSSASVVSDQSKKGNDGEIASNTDPLLERSRSAPSSNNQSGNGS